MTNVEENIKNMLKVSLKKQAHSFANNNNTNNNNNDEPERNTNKMLRVKFEYNDQTRALSLQRPVRFEDLYQKISQSLDIQTGLTLHYINPNKEIFGQITNQNELEQIVICVDQNAKFRSLRVLVTTSTPQKASSNSPSDRFNKKSHGTRPDSPPPGYLHPKDVDSECSPSYPSSHVGGEFIPEDDAISTSQSGDSSYSSSRQSILEQNWGGSGRRSKLTNLTSHSEIPDNERITGQPNLGTFPLRIHNAPYTKPEGRQTLPHIRKTQDFYPHMISSGHSSSNTSSFSRELESNFSNNLDKTMTRAKIPSLTNYKKGPLLGRGGFGHVFKCLDVETGREFAMKEVLLTSVNCCPNDAVNKDAECLENEINIYRELMCHQRIVQYFGAKRDQNAMYIFMEYMAGGSVKDQIRQYGALSHNIIARYSKQILQGLAFLHQKMIIHRDVKAANILRDIDGNVKLSDFGASRYLKSISIHNVSQRRTNLSDTVSSGNNNRGGVANSFCGTFFWMAPEVIRGEAYSISADIWSLGSTLVEMLTGNPPYYELEPYAALYRIANTNRVDFKSVEPVSNEMRSFIDKMFVSNPQTRSTAEELLNSNFMKSVES